MYPISNSLKVTLLRIAVVDPEGSGGNVVFSVGTSCEVRKVANDGVWASVVGDPGTTYYLTGSSRADFAVRCTNDVDSIGIGFGQSDGK